MSFENAGEIAAWRMCLGCGACEWACETKAIRLVDLIEDGIRPLVDGSCRACGRCVSVCPGIDVAHGEWDGRAVMELSSRWGPVLELCEGHAADEEIRYKGSSGGVASALALYCLEREGMHGVLHAGADGHEPWRNRTRMSTERSGVLGNAGSRYSPASPCDGLGIIEEAPSPCVFIGKPCDVSGLRKAEKLSGVLSAKTGLAISIFCAGTPSTRGTLDLLARFRKHQVEVESLRYRGYGWPGGFEAETKDGHAHASYKDAWSFLQKYRPLRCHLCPDGTGEFADISCGDPWYREITPGEAGLSLVIVRTARGRRILKAAESAGYVTVRRIDNGLLERSQPNLLEKRRAVWGRLLALRLLLVPVPRLRGFSLLRNWAGLPFYEKMRSVLGTLRRAFTREYYRRSKAFPAKAAMRDISIIRKRGAK